MQMILRCLLSAVFLSLAGGVYAETADQASIARLLHSMFDKPGATLSVSPVVVSADYAIADWAQGDMGGRALLRRKQQEWSLVLCAGDGIKSREALTKAGVSVESASQLEQQLATAENKLTPVEVAMFSRFEGLVMMDGSVNQPFWTFRSPKVKSFITRRIVNSKIRVRRARSWTVMRRHSA